MLSKESIDYNLSCVIEKGVFLKNLRKLLKWIVAKVYLFR